MSEPAASSPWDDALLAGALLAVDPQGLAGIHARARAGWARDRWLQATMAAFSSDAPMRRITAGIAEARLTGGLDIGATLSAGRPVLERGVLSAADGGLVVLSMAERLEASAAGIIGAVLDNGEVRVERDGISTIEPARFALIALDEGIDQDEMLAPALGDRIGLLVDLNAVALHAAVGSIDRGAVAAARMLLPSVSISEDMICALCEAAMECGALSMRASLKLVRAARAAAALRGRAKVEVEDAATALRLVLGMRSSADQPAEPAPEERDDQEQQSGRSADEETPQSIDASQDMAIDAVEAVLPRHLLAGLEMAPARRRGAGPSGKAGAMRNRARRGRAVGVVDKPPVTGARLDVLSTLRQAAPWQRVRTPGGTWPAARLRIRKEDFRYIRYREKTGTTAIFAVDASGSAAVERLAETKGAVELLLAECYVRRDSVALIAFRGGTAETLLEATRSLVRAKRSLSALPGGGGTPLAGGIAATLSMAAGLQRKGQSVVTVFLTDGRGNVALDGSSVRTQVEADLARASRLFRAAGIRSILIDTAQRPQTRAKALARDLGAEYLALPRGGARAMAREIGARMEG